uniref:Uncharacterized protein n=1 Tax=Arundo donax TaxID=35708 RepID=A0A0A9F8Y4_ARUDO
MRERQEHFQKQRIENSMGSSEPTAKQISYLRNLGCTITPTSRLHASHLIESTNRSELLVAKIRRLELKLQQRLASC